MLYTEKEKHEIERVKEVFAEHLRQTLQTFITGIDTPFAEGGTAFLRRTFLRFFFLSVSLSFACPYRII